MLALNYETRRAVVTLSNFSASLPKISLVSHFFQFLELKNVIKEQERAFNDKCTEMSAALREQSVRHAADIHTVQAKCRDQVVEEQRKAREALSELRQRHDEELSDKNQRIEEINQNNGEELHMLTIEWEEKLNEKFLRSLLLQ